MKSRRRHLVYTAVLLIVACRGDDNRPPTAESISVDVIEDSVASWSLRGTDPERQPLSYRVLSNPGHGRLEIDTGTGAFLYAPDPDFFGVDSFSYSVSDGRASSAPAFVTLLVENINDPPTLGEIPELQNSAETNIVVHPLTVGDVDDDQLTIGVSSDDPNVASVDIDPVSNTILISPHEYGQTAIHVNVSDSKAGALRAFQFSVRDVTKFRTIIVNPAEAITLSNATDRPIAFRLTHNEFPMFQSDQEMAEYVRGMSSEFADEPFERKLWRFVRDNVYHAVPLTVDQWLYDPWVTVNSLGWGFCGHVAAVYVRIARAAGYDARIWGLTGHVVPEIRIGDRWEMYDPDIAVYYRNRNGQVAGVDELAADSSLITSPLNPIFGVGGYSYPYNDFIAQFYGTPADNFIGDGIFLAQEPSEYQPLTLPAGATFTYSGHWVDSVVGVDVDVPYLVPHFLQAALETRAGWTGTVTVPWMIWDIQGEGSIEIEGTAFSVGSQALMDRLRDPGEQIDSVRVINAPSTLTFVLFINATRYELAPENAVALTGKDVWAIVIGTEEVPAIIRVPWNSASVIRKPQASLP